MELVTHMYKAAHREDRRIDLDRTKPENLAIWYQRL